MDVKDRVMVAKHRERILVVEDDEGVASLERRHLERAGYEVCLAGTAQEALNHLGQLRVDLIVLDYRLPGNLDGLAFYNQVKAAGYDLPVILVTAFSTEATVIQALRLGVRDFVSKSLEYLDYLPEAVDRVLKQVRTEHQLAESEARLASIIGSAKDAIIVVTQERKITLFNTAAERMFRCSAAAALHQPLSRFIPNQVAVRNPEDSDPALGSVTHQIRSGTTGRRADGEVFPLEASVSRAKLGDRKFYTVIVRDISERKLLESRLEEQAALLDEARDAIMVHDLEDRILFWSRGAERLYGWKRAEALRANAKGLLEPTPSLEREEAHRVVLETGDWSGELRQVNSQGQEVIVESRQALLRDERGQPKAKLIINTNVTEKKKLEVQFLHAQRMEGIGVLAGGIAHDFNNLLTIINGYSEILLNGLPPEDPSRQLLTEICRAGERAAGLTRQLLTFSRRQILKPQILDLNNLVGETKRMLSRLIGEDIILETALAPELGRIKADPGQVEQAIMNLVVNARDAMPKGGRLTIETSNLELDEHYARTHTDVAPGDYVMLAVSDTGFGMDPAVKSQIFEPFFTTKEVGKGTGLGLATVYGIVKQSGGNIEVYSEKNVGTTFKLYFPRVQDTEPAEIRAAEPFRIPKGTETVLLAEDEDGVRLMVRLALESNGYTVLEAQDGDKAFDICRDYPRKIDLLVTDVVMPSMGGRQLADQLHALHPALKVLYLSGYTDDAVIRHGVLDAEMAFLQKPFTPTALAKKVREVLDSVASNG
jgi:two-component system, cell cycle sensor histidine kinase and response regulator CckA